MRADSRKWNIFWRMVLIVYAVWMIWLLFFRSRSGVWEDSSGYWEHVRTQYNLKPFHMIFDYWHVLTNREYYIQKWEAVAIYRYQARQAFINLFGNIVTMIPLGFLLPVNFPRLRGIWRTLLAVSLIIATVEITQLFTLAGHCDIDDLILNLLGASIGYGAFRLIGSPKAGTEKG